MRDYRKAQPVEIIVNDAYFTIRNNNLLMQLSNHGRGLESVYFIGEYR
jgi:hypothetical protein